MSLIQLACLLGAALVCAAPATAQTPPAKAPATAPDAALEAAKSAFLALPLATRVAVQGALVWLGFYNGTADGDFGKRTRDSIVAWQRSIKATPDAVLGPSLLAALLQAGKRARDAAGFLTITDAKTGARIGSPTKLVGKGGASLDFASDASGDLAGLYARLSADGPARKILYKAMKPSFFFVVSGRDGARKFYARYDF